MSANPDAAEAIDAVGHTALGVARARATESARPDALFDDPYAVGFDPGGFAADAGRRSRDPAAVRRMYNWIVARTVFLDDLVAGATVDQIVLLGAGLDTRALRLPLSAETVVYELDRRQLFDYKEPILAADGGGRPDRGLAESIV
nr:SAM-dependent methyltransferase [Jongsikchunia kroppenstedtii]